MVAPVPKGRHCLDRRRLTKALTKLSPLFLFLLLLLQISMPANAILGRWPSLEAVQSRFPGCCANLGFFDCGDGICLSVSHFHNGIVDCSDGSDEYCFPEQISCGTFCADLIHLGECIGHAKNCTESADQKQSPFWASFCPLLKKDLCGLANTVSCRGYGECVFDKWLHDGKRDCLDGSDEDDTYTSLFKTECPSNFVVGHQLTVPTPFPSKVGTFASLTLAPFAPVPSSVPPSFRISLAITPSSVWESTTVEKEEQKGGTISDSTALDDFGAEFARFLRTRTSEISSSFGSNAAPSVTTPQFGAVLGAEKNVEEWIIFPSNLPFSAATPKGILMNEWPKGKATTTASKNINEVEAQSPKLSSPILVERMPTEAKEGSQWNWMAGKGIAGGEGKERGGEEVGEVQKAKQKQQQFWMMPLPFHRPQKVATIGTTMAIEETAREKAWGTPKGKIGIGSTNMEGMDKEFGQGRAGAMPTKAIDQTEWKESGGVIGGQSPETKQQTRNFSQSLSFQSPSSQSLSSQSPLSQSPSSQSPSSQSPISQSPISQSLSSQSPLSQSPLSQSPLSQSLPSQSPLSQSPISQSLSSQSPLSQSPLSQSLSSQSPSVSSSSDIISVPNQSPSPWRPSADRWARPISSNAIANASKLLQLSGLSCTERIRRMENVPVQCACPAGQFETFDGSCAFANVSTFRAKISSLCDANSFSSSFSPPQDQLVILKLIDAFPDQPFCVRKIMEDGQIVVNTICAMECTTEMLANATKSSGNLPEVHLEVSELTGGACHRFDLNNCDEKAQCLLDGLRFRCRCLPGTKDTSPEGDGRKCEGTVIQQICIKLFGVCVLVWLLILLLLLCFLLPILCLLCLKYCFRIDPALLNVRLRHILKTLVDKLKGRGPPPAVPIITTSQIGEEIGDRRDSQLIGVIPTDAAVGTRDEADTLKVPSMTIGLRPATIHSSQHLVPSDSEDYLIVEEEEGEEQHRTRDTVEGRETKREEETGEGVEKRERQPEKQTVRQSTELSSKSEPGVTVVPQVKDESLPSTETKSEEAVEETTEVEVHEQGERVEEEKESTARETVEEAERPKSAASRTGTPTIWDQYKILGDQFAKYGSLDVEKRKRSMTESLEELLQKREGVKDVEQRVEDAIERRQVAENGGQEEIVEERGRAEEIEQQQLNADLALIGMPRVDRQQQTAVGHEIGERMPTKRQEEPEEEPREAGRAMPSDTLREGTLNIGFVMPPQSDGSGKARKAPPVFVDTERQRPFPAQQKQQQHIYAPFRRRPFGEARLFERKAMKSVINGRPTFERTQKKGVISSRRREAGGGTEFVVVKGGRMGKEEKSALEEEERRMRKLGSLEEKGQRWKTRGEEERKIETEEVKDGEDERKRRGRSVTGQQRRDAFVRGELRDVGLRDGTRKRECRVTPSRAFRMVGQPAAEDRLAEVRKTKSLKKVPISPPMFDPDIPSTSQAADFWERNLRRGFSPALQLEEYAKKRTDRFQWEGLKLHSIEEQMEERVHSGCITDRKPWNISPIPEPDLPAPPMREITGLSDGSLPRSVERSEKRVHSGCITWRKPWNSSPHKDKETMHTTSSFWDMEKHGHAVDGMPLAEGRDMDSSTERRGRTGKRGHYEEEVQYAKEGYRNQIQGEL